MSELLYLHASSSHHRAKRSSGFHIPRIGWHGEDVKRLAGLMAAMVFLGPAPASSQVEADWRPDVPAAVRYASGRQGEISFAVLDEDGRLQGHAISATAPMAS